MSTRTVLLTPFRVGLALALAWLVFAVLNLSHYGITSDSPALFYSGDGTLFWLGHRSLPDALNYAGADPADFHTPFQRYPDVNDPLHYPVLPGFIGALTCALFNRRLGWVGVLDGHHLGLVLIHAASLVAFTVYASRLLGRVAGIAGAVALALFPCAVGHAFNNAKDWPCALFYALTILATGSGIIRAKARDVFAGAIFLGLALSCKMNAVFALASLALWLPIAWLLLHRRRRAVQSTVVAATLVGPYVSFGLFVLLWPWIYQGETVADWWDHFNGYVQFMAHFGVSERLTWTAYPVRCVLYMTPPLVLAAAGVEVLCGWRGREALAKWFLLALWIGLPLLRMAVPKSNFYDANRHFIEYVPALCAMAGAGFAIVWELLARIWQRVRVRVRAWPRGRAFGAVATATCMAILVWPVVVYHPYEVTYFNSFIGGLGGAQRRALFTMPSPHDYRSGGTEGDYWYSSFRDALRTIHANTMGRTDFSVATCDPIVAKSYTALEWEAPPLPMLSVDPAHADYVVVIPRAGYCPPKVVTDLEAARPRLTRVEREGGIIYEVLAPPR